MISARISWGGGSLEFRASDSSGTRYITTQGLLDLTYQIRFNDRRRGTALIEVNDTPVLNINNEYTRRETIQVPCSGPAEYLLGTNARDQCKAGHSKISRSQYRFRSTFGPSSGQPRWNSSQTFNSWRDGTFDTAGWSRSGHNQYSRPTHGGFTIVQIQTRTAYFCRKDPGCKEDQIEIVTAYRASMNGSLGQFRNGKTAAELEAEREAEREAARRRQNELDRQRAAAEAAARKAAELEKAREAEALRKQQEANQKLIDQLVGNAKQIRDIPITNTGFSKYRVISPVKYRQAGSNLIPQVRYESVQELSPEAVSNLVYRGFEVQAVDPTTPLSSSKAYGPSVVKHATNRVPTKSAGFVPVSGRRAAIQREEGKRSSYRRVIR